MKAFIIAALLFLPVHAHAQNQTTFRDAGGRTIGTTTTDSNGTTTFRDASGRTTGTATFSNQGSAGGTTTFRNSGGPRSALGRSYYWHRINAVEAMTMDHLLNLIFLAVALIALGRMIQLGNRIAVSSETTAVVISTFYANMTPEARAKADEYLKSLRS